MLAQHLPRSLPFRPAGWRRLLRYSLIAMGLWVLGAGIIAAAGMAARPRPADLALVLGNTVDRSNRPLPRLQARLEAALALYQRGGCAVIMVSGGIDPQDGRDEAVGMAYPRSTSWPTRSATTPAPRPNMHTRGCRPMACIVLWRSRSTSICRVRDWPCARPASKTPVAITRGTGLVATCIPACAKYPVIWRTGPACTKEPVHARKCPLRLKRVSFGDLSVQAHGKAEPLPNPPLQGEGAVPRRTAA